VGSARGTNQYRRKTTPRPPVDRAAQLKLIGALAANKNPRVTPQELEQLSYHQQPGPRELAAAHPDAPAPLLRRLARDPALQVRRAVASNPHTPGSTLGRLSRDPEQDVRQRVGGNPSCPSPVQRRIANSPDWEDRAWVANNKSADPQVLTEMLRDTDQYVLQLVLDNPRTPTAAVAMLQLVRGRNPAAGS